MDEGRLEDREKIETGEADCIACPASGSRRSDVAKQMKRRTASSSKRIKNSIEQRIFIPDLPDETCYPAHPYPRMIMKQSLRQYSEKAAIVGRVAYKVKYLGK